MKLHNDFNKLLTGDFTEKQHNLLIAINEKFKELEKDKNRTEITMSFAELKKLAEFKCRGNDRFLNAIRGLREKILSTRQVIVIDENTDEMFNIFSKMRIDAGKKEVIISLNKDFEYMFFDVQDCYSNLDIKEYFSIKGNYAKIMYRCCSQWAGRGYIELKIADFKTMLQIPKSYQMTHITNKILKPVTEELKEFFPKISFEKVKKDGKVVSVVFLWQRVERKKSIKKSEIVQGAGAKKLYNKELAEEKTIKAEKEIANLKAEEKLAEIVKTNLSNNVVEGSVEKITSNEYMEIYNDYLKANNIEHSVYVKKGFDIMNKGKYQIIPEEK